MDTLNDDCQLLIIKYLDLEQQFALFEATNKEETTTNRIRSNLSYTWQSQRSFSLNVAYFDKRSKLMHDFVFSISAKVQHLKLYDVTWDILKCWRQYKFPEMRTLEYTLLYSVDDNDFYSKSELVIQLMADLFPGLHTMKPDGNFDLIHLRNWTDLRKLDMVQFHPIEQTFESGKSEKGGLQMLEDLIIYTDDFSEDQFNSFVTLAKLRKLTLRDLEYTSLTRIIEMRAKDIEGIILNCLYFYQLSDIRKLVNLRQVTLMNLNFDDDVITSEEFKKLFGGLPLLERVDLIYSKIWSSEI